MFYGEIKETSTKIELFEVAADTFHLTMKYLYCGTLGEISLQVC